ncbi:MAG: anti-sigma factor [Devosia sp.]
MSTEGHDSDGLDEDKILVGEYVLGLLDAAEHARIAKRIAAEPPLAAELKLWQSWFSSLDHQFAETPAPAVTFRKIEARLFGAPAGPWAGFWDNLLLWRGLAAGSLAVAAVAIGFNLMQPARLDPQQFATQLVAALQSQEGSGVEFVALYNTATGEVRLTALSGSPIPDKDYELWMIEASGTPVSMGVIAMERTEMTLPEDLQDHLTSGTVLAVTLEPKGGSPTGGPTGPMVAMGKATMI